MEEEACTIMFMADSKQGTSLAKQACFLFGGGGGAGGGIKIESKEAGCVPFAYILAAGFAPFLISAMGLNRAALLILASHNQREPF